jgi:hypothetical protein
MSWYMATPQVQHIRKVITSFNHLLKKDISDVFPSNSMQITPSLKDETLAERCRDAPFAVLSHSATPTNSQAAKFTYANVHAQELFEYPLEQLLALPSALSAEAPNREERATMLERSKRDGFFTNYVGIRISKSGKRFKMHDGVIWTVYDLHQDGTLDESKIVGQAAAFSQITPESPTTPPSLPAEC